MKDLKEELKKLLRVNDDLSYHNEDLKNKEKMGDALRETNKVMKEREGQLYREISKLEEEKTSIFASSERMVL